MGNKMQFKKNTIGDLMSLWSLNSPNKEIQQRIEKQRLNDFYKFSLLWLIILVLQAIASSI